MGGREFQQKNEEQKKKSQARIPWMFFFG